MTTKTVLVFDICSSTTMLDILHSESSVDMYFTLLRKITKFVELESVFLQYEVYKFPGDGFILLFPEDVSADMVLHFSLRLVLRCDALIRKFVSSKLPNQPIPRIGITCGIDRDR